MTQHFLSKHDLSTFIILLKAVQLTIASLFVSSTARDYSYCYDLQQVRNLNIYTWLALCKNDPKFTQ